MSLLSYSHVFNKLGAAHPITQRMEFKMENQIVSILQLCGKMLASETFVNHGNMEPTIFVQVPFRGTCAMMFLRDITHPSETVACMDLIYESLLDAGLDVCVIANDLSTIEINI